MEWLALRHCPRALPIGRVLRPKAAQLGKTLFLFVCLCLLGLLLSAALWLPNVSWSCSCKAVHSTLYFVNSSGPHPILGWVNVHGPCWKIKQKRRTIKFWAIGNETIRAKSRSKWSGFMISRPAKLRSSRAEDASNSIYLGVTPKDNNENQY